MLQVQRPARRGPTWRVPGGPSWLLASAGRLAFLPDRASIAALAVTGIAWVTVAQTVESHYLRFGLLLPLATLMAVAGGLAVANRLRRNRAREAASVAHDLRGPLVTLQATLELLAGDAFGALPETARAAVLRAATTSARAALVVDEAMHRAAAPPSAAPLRGHADLDLVVREALDALEVQVRSAGAVVMLTSLPRVAADSSALFRVFVNLFQNAIKYHRPDATPLLKVSAEVEGESAILAVADDGIGIAPGDRERVFEPRYRTMAGSARSSGEGLGLANVQRLVTAMGGAIWVDGTAERGTTIRLRLPLA